MQRDGRTRLKRAAWSVPGLAILVLLPWILLETPAWRLAGPNGWVVYALALAYVLAATVLAAADQRLRTRAFVLAAALAAASLVLIYLALLLRPQDGYSRLLLLTETVAFLGGLCATELLPRLSGRAVLYLGVALAGAGLLGVLAAPRFLDLAPAARGLTEGGGERTRTLSASQHILVAKYDPVPLPPPIDPSALGGAITPEPGGDAYLLVRAHGDVYRLSWLENDELRVEHVGFRVPINVQDFAMDAGDSIPTSIFRVADLLAARDTLGNVRLFASHHYWNRRDLCFVVRVSTRVLDPVADLDADSPSGWATLFESSPCLPIALARGGYFGGDQVGGNLELLNQHTLLLTMGDNQFDGWFRSPDFVSDSTAHYGKVLRIDLRSAAVSVYTWGHRNPQGLVIDPSGWVWSTEHGPQGGDELNLLQESGDYGYPTHTFGTEYGSVTWPLGEEQVRAGSVLPIFAWVPSIGISDLVVVTDPAFERWRGDLLIASLRGQALWRTRLQDSRVIYAEPIRIDERVRDIATAGKGEFVLWTDSETIVRIRSADELSDGSVLYTLNCGGCHSEFLHQIGPMLWGVFRRPIGSAEGYNYSTALRQLGGRWTDERMDAFIAAPNSYAPGTTMAFEGLPDPAERGLIIAYITSYYASDSRR